MRHTLEQFIHALRNPETASSVLPLTAVIGIFLLASAGSIYFFVRALRTPEESGAEPRSQGLLSLMFLNTGSRFAGFFKGVFRIGDERVRQLLAEIAALRKQIETLELEKKELREQHAHALSRITELLGEIASTQGKIIELKTELETAETQRDKLKTRADDLEAQLREVMSEVDNMYQANAKALDASNDRRLKAQKRSEDIELQLSQFLTELERFYRGSSNLQQFQALGNKFAGVVPGGSANPTLEGTVTAQAEQIKKLKELLQVCRVQIVAIQKRITSTPPKHLS